MAHPRPFRFGVQLHTAATAEEWAAKARRAAVAESMAPMFGLDADLVLDYPLASIGTEDQIVESLQARRERWDVSYLVVQADAMESAAPIVARLAGA